MVMAIPSCASCTHYQTGDGKAPPTCSAFPDGIPAEILTGKHAHLTAYRGDNGIRYEADPNGPEVLRAAVPER